MSIVSSHPRATSGSNLKYPNIALIHDTYSPVLGKQPAGLATNCSFPKPARPIFDIQELWADTLQAPAESPRLDRNP
jgi:hypothetical protein